MTLTMLTNMYTHFLCCWSFSTAYTIAKIRYMVQDSIQVRWRQSVCKLVRKGDALFYIPIKEEIANTGDWCPRLSRFTLVVICPTDQPIDSRCVEIYIFF